VVGTICHAEHSEASAPGEPLLAGEMQIAMEQKRTIFYRFNSIRLTRNWKILHSVQDDKIFYSMPPRNKFALTRLKLSH
jgi:hypothetical protein